LLVFSNIVHIAQSFFLNAQTVSGSLNIWTSLCVCGHTWCTANSLYADKNWEVWLWHKSVHKI